MELLHALGLDTKILIAQLVNFAVLLFVLWKFGYRPLLKFLDERQEKIEAGIKNAEAAEKRLHDIDDKEQTVLRQAQKEAQALIEKTNEHLNQRKKEMMAKTKEEIAAIVKKTKEELEVEKKIIFKNIKQETADLVVAALGKIISEKLDASVDAEYVKKVIHDVSS